MDEFDIIHRYWKPLGAGSAAGVIRGIGDDCAELSVPAGQNLIQSVDTLVSGIHFLPGISPDDLGWRALAVSASDLAAAGAAPWTAMLAITLPILDSSWLEGFSRGLGEACKAFGLQVTGGDSTSGPLTISVHVQGLCPPGQSLTRSGARPGDLICVSGSLGDAGEALRWLEEETQDSAVVAVKGRYLRPMPRLDLGIALRHNASACIDISDGLLADLGHILAASNVGATLDLSSIPLSAALDSLAGQDALQRGLVAGDDYELCFTWPLSAGDPTRLATASVPVTIIGSIEAESGLRFENCPPGWVVPAAGGYRHFQASARGG